MVFLHYLIGQCILKDCLSYTC